MTNVPAEEVENAVADFVRSVREFGDLNSRGDIATDLNAGIRWWRALEYLALADSRLKECFAAGTEARHPSGSTTGSGSR